MSNETEWVLVPREASSEMLTAAIDAHLGFEGEDEVDAVWAAMISAAEQFGATAGHAVQDVGDGAEGGSRAPTRPTHFSGMFPRQDDPASSPLSQPPAEAQGGWDLKEVVCLACGDHIMPMGQVCHACSHPVSAPPSAPVRADVGDKDCLTTRARELLADEYRKRGIGTGLVNDAGTATNVAIAAIAAALSQQPAAVDEMGELVGLLDEVRSHFTRDDDLPDDLLPRIDAALAGKQGGDHA